MSGHLFSYGHGYSAAALTELLQPNGWTITGTTRNPEKALILRKTGMNCIVTPHDTLSEDIKKSTHLLISAAPTADGDPFLRDHLQHLKDAKKLEWVGYLSTTGVYGDHEGGWVDEASQLTPATERGKARVDKSGKRSRAQSQNFQIGRHIRPRPRPLCQGAQWDSAAHH